MHRDQQAEAHTHVDGIVGDLRFAAKSGVTLPPDWRYLAVFEAKQVLLRHINLDPGVGQVNQLGKGTPLNREFTDVNGISLHQTIQRRSDNRIAHLDVKCLPLCLQLVDARLQALESALARLVGRLNMRSSSFFMPRVEPAS